MKQLKQKFGLLTSSLLILCYLAPTPILAKMAETFSEYSPQIVQLATTIPCLTGVIVALLMGKLTTFIYKRYLILFSGVCYFVGGIIPFFLHKNLGIILFAAAIMGIGLGIRLIGIASLICECFDEKERGVLLGLQATFICGGGVIFTWLGGQLGATEWHKTYLAYLLVIVVLIIEFICIPKGYLEEKQSEKKGKIFIPKTIWFIAILGFIVYAFITVYNSNVAMLVEARAFGNAAQAGLAATSYTLAGAIAGAFTGPLIKKMNEHVFIFVSGLAIIGMLLCFFSTTLPMLCVGGMFCGASFSVFTAASNFFATLNAGEQNKSICLSMFSALANLGQAVSPLLIGLVLGFASLEQKFLYTGIIFIFIIIFVLVGIKKLCRFIR